MLTLILVSVFAIIPTGDWSGAAVPGLITSGGFRLGLEPCTLIVTETADGYSLPHGGRIARDQRFIGCVPGTDVAIFQ